jgi:hypothetical protein
MHDRPQRSPFESFDHLQHVKESLARQGYFFYPVEKEHTEALVTEPLVRRIHLDIKKRGFRKLVEHISITFSGYAYDQREIFQVPEIRAYWQQLDRELPELPALLAYLPTMGFNGPGQHLELLGTIDQAIPEPERRRYLLHIPEGPTLIADATRRIQQAGATYHLPQPKTALVAERFRQRATTV